VAADGDRHGVVEQFEHRWPRLKVEPMKGMEPVYWEDESTCFTAARWGVAVAEQR
jgi:hypothetical protein